MSTSSRLVATLIVLVLWLALNSVFDLSSSATTIASAALAGKQFENSDTTYVASQVGSALLSALKGPSMWALLIALVAIWWVPLRRFFSPDNETVDLALILVGLVALGVSRPAEAYFDTSERTEAYTILPNESAFWIPDVGDNKAAQGKFDSEAFLSEKKIPVKRFVIPHHKLGNSGGYLGWDKYVPDGRLIIVDRTPFSREWVSGSHRGTSNKDESIPCQSKEGLNISVGVSIGASVLEENAAKYLYRFGVVAPQGDRTSGEVIFTSVYYSRKLADVMDDVGRKKVQTLICGQISTRSFDKANEEAADIIVAVKKDAEEYFKSVGITLDFIGWADTFTFDHDVQKAVNDAYIAQKLSGAVQLLQALGQIRVQEGLGKGLGDKGPPVVITPGMIDTILGAVKTTTSGMAQPPAQVTPAAKK